MKHRAEVCAKALNKRKGRKILALSGRLKNVFSRRQLGLVQEETLVAFYTRMPRETVRTTWNEVEIRKKFSSGSKHRLQYRKWKTQTDEKAWTVWRPALWLKLKITCLWWARWKISSCDYRHHPVCRGYKSGNRCIHGYRCPCRQADGKSATSARGRK